MYIAAFDPGLTTGFARVAVNEREGLFGTGPVCPFRIITAGELLDVQDVSTALWMWTNVRLVEAFIGAGPRSTEAVHSIKLWGLIEWTPNPVYESVVIVQQPQWRKPFVSRAVELLEAGGFEKSRHAADALAHILYYIHKNKLE